jgi:hypothetical protein
MPENMIFRFFWRVSVIINIGFLLIDIEKIIWVITFDGIPTFALTDYSLEFIAVKQLFFNQNKKQNIFQVR